MDGSAMERWTTCNGLLVMDGLAMERWTACDELLGDGAMDGSRWTAWRWSTRTAWRWSTRWLSMDGVAMDCACNGLCDRRHGKWPAERWMDCCNFDRPRTLRRRLGDDLLGIVMDGSAIVGQLTTYCCLPLANISRMTGSTEMAGNRPIFQKPK